MLSEHPAPSTPFRAPATSVVDFFFPLMKNGKENPPFHFKTSVHKDRPWVLIREFHRITACTSVRCMYVLYGTVTRLRRRRRRERVSCRVRIPTKNVVGSHWKTLDDVWPRNLLVCSVQEQKKLQYQRRVSRVHGVQQLLVTKTI